MQHMNLIPVSYCALSEVHLSLHLQDIKCCCMFVVWCMQKEIKKKETERSKEERDLCNSSEYYCSL
jgi:hypothetical protein